MSVATAGFPSTSHFDNALTVLKDDAFRAQIVSETGILAVFVITKGNDSVSYVFDFKTNGTITKGEDPAADVTFKLSDDDCNALIEGTAEVKALLGSGALTFTGSEESAKLIPPAMLKVASKYKESK